MLVGEPSRFFSHSTCSSSSLGVEEQGSPAQILRDILGDLVLAHLQALAQLHHHLVALLPAQQGDQADQGLAGGVADAHPLGHLHQVGEVGGDVEHVLPQAVLHLVLEQLDAHYLDDPVCGALQVVQEDLTGHVLLIQGRLIVGHVLPPPAGGPYTAGRAAAGSRRRQTGRPPRSEPSGG